MRVSTVGLFTAYALRSPTVTKPPERLFTAASESVKDKARTLTLLPARSSPPKTAETTGAVLEETSELFTSIRPPDLESRLAELLLTSSAKTVIEEAPALPRPSLTSLLNSALVVPSTVALG